MKQPELGRKILELRKEKGLTQEELVELCNINVRTIQRIEAGEVTPRHYTLKNILKALDYELDDIKTDLENSVSISKTQLFALTLAFWLGVLIIPMDSYGIFYELIQYYKIDQTAKYQSEDLYKISTILGTLFSVAFFVGYYIIGKIYKNFLLKVSSILMISVTIMSCLLTLYTIHWDENTKTILAFVEMSIIGAVGIPFGIGIMKSNQNNDQFTKITGIFTLIVYGSLLTIIFSLFSIMFYFPVLILQLILIYKIREKLVSL